MPDEMIVIHDDQIDVQDIMRQIRANIARRKGETLVEDVDPAAISEALWTETIGESARMQTGSDRIPLTQQDCDIVPRGYVIDWRNPVLGPPHSVVRRMINAEVRRYLDTSLAKQTRFNENVLRALRNLAQENAGLRSELEELRAARSEEATGA